MKKLFPSLLLAFLALGTAISAHAEQKIVFINIGSVFKNAPHTQETEKRLKEQFRPRQQELQKQAQELEQLQQRLSKESLVMSAEKKAELEKEVRVLERKMKWDEQDFRADLDLEKNNEFQKIHQIIAKAIKALGKKEGYDLVLTEGVVYASTSVDITDQVLAQLKAEHQTKSRDKSP